MRILEIVLLIALGAGLIAWISARHRSALRNSFLIAAAVAAVALVLHLLIDGARWQMTPAYALTVVLSIVALISRKREFKPVRERSRHWGRRAASWAGGAALALLFLVAAGLPTIFPVNILPEPTGGYAIGSTQFFVVDPRREEPFTARADRRTLDVKAWYPATPGAAGDRDHLWGKPGLVAREFSSALGLPSWFLSHLALTPAHSQSDAPIARKRAPFPTIVFSHGYAQGFAGQNTALFEDLASHGYVVLGINHPHEGMVARRPDGTLVRGDREQFKRFGNEIREVFPAIEQVGRTRDPAKADALMRDTIRRMPVSNRSLALWTGDIAVVLDRLRQINAGALAQSLRGGIDETRVALMGMSFGAAAATEACITDARCIAAVNLDGTPLGSVLDQRTAKPVLFLVNGNDVSRANLPIYRRTGPGSYFAVVGGAQHLDFSDLPLISPVFRWMGALGSVGGPEATAVMRDYVRAFLDTELKRQPSRLSAVAAEHPKVMFLPR